MRKENLVTDFRKRKDLRKKCENIWSAIKTAKRIMSRRYNLPEIFTNNLGKGM